MKKKIFLMFVGIFLLGICTTNAQVSNTDTTKAVGFWDQFDKVPDMEMNSLTKMKVDMYAGNYKDHKTFVDNLWKKCYKKGQYNKELGKEIDAANYLLIKDYPSPGAKGKKINIVFAFDVKDNVINGFKESLFFFSLPGKIASNSVMGDEITEEAGEFIPYKEEQGF